MLQTVMPFLFSSATPGGETPGDDDENEGQRWKLDCVKIYIISLSFKIPIKIILIDLH